MWSRNRDVFKKFALSSILPYFAEPLLFILALGYGLGIFVGEINGVSYAQFLAPGILSSSAMFAASYECTYSTFVRMIFQKTFDAILCTPLMVEDIVLGEILWGATKSLISGICIFIVILALGLISLESAVIIIPTIIIVGLMFSSLSMFFTSIVPTIDSFNYYFTLLVSPMFLLSGVFFPIENLPPIVKDISWWLPLTHAVNIIRSAALGEHNPSFLLDISWMIVFTLIFYALSTVLMKKRLIQ
ncbi:ABC transporter permease [Methanooceanicella nereidis]|uniref:ABC transporter permease n=1 Tax=Methanooceanicella nereidis TaxID=2052831 RepID=UPI0034E25846